MTASKDVKAQVSNCAKWNNHLAVVDVFPNLCPGGSCPNPQDLSFGNRRTYYGWLYSDTADQACQKWKNKLYPNVAGAVSKGSPTATGYTCSIAGTAYAQSIELELVQRESCCDRTIVGPHASLTPDVYYVATQPFLTGPFPPADGVDFSTYKLTPSIPTWTIPSQREKVLARNQAKGLPPWYIPLPIYGSDLYRPGYEALRPLEPASCQGWLQGDSTCAPELDHIIPQKDVYGCNCGSNSISNALLISKSLNGEMSNDCSHPKRRAILDAFDPTVGVARQERGALRENSVSVAVCVRQSVWTL